MIKKNKIKISSAGIIALSFFVVPAALAELNVGSNLGPSGYPEPSCVKPEKLEKNGEITSREEQVSYNIKVREYNEAISNYANCIEDYVKNANNDMETIERKANEAVREANSRND